ncbi:DoxX family protein [Aestuariivivens insulae]|uniref:DoxX family protein n=1 Tax=Aestuariivivens insulae TaxID=1621988 RepID=UPI001F59BFB0|nr:DoxX family protein [Aestuariivivens insulae]
MKIFITISRLIVGSLFIVSGLIKCNDSIGFSYKLNDYFAADVLNLEFLIPYSLMLAVMICVVEIVLGIAVLFGFKSKLTSTLILLMMLFFTWLTWYTSSCLHEQEVMAKLGEEFTKNCVTDCGCFGDALKLEPIESFYKDLFLLLFTVPLFFASFKGMIPVNTPKQDKFYMATSLALILGFGVLVIGWWFTVLFSIVTFLVVYLLKSKISNQWVLLLMPYVLALGFTWYCLQHLPLKDFRPYKVGANIPEGMAIPEDAPKAVIEYTWKFNVDGNEKVVVTDGSYPNIEGEFVGVETQVVKEGYEPPIHDFSIETDSTNLTDEYMQTEKLLMVVCYSLQSAEDGGLDKLKDISNEASKAGYTVIGVTASGDDDKKALKERYKLNFDFYICDEKALKTVVRSNPGFVVLNNGTITQKAHWNDAEGLEF